MAICEALEDPRGIAWNLEVFAALLAAAGRADGAARLWGASDQLLDSVGAALSTEIRWIRDHYLNDAQVSLGEEAFEAARGVGRSLPLGYAVTYAREQTLGLC